MNNETIASIETAIARRKPLLKITNALRLVNGLGDDLPGLVLEQYGDRHVIHLFDRRWIAEKEALTAFVRDRLNARYLIIKERLDSKALNAGRINAGIRIDQAPSRTVVVENGLQFGVDLNDGLNSGLFLDMRHNRKLVAGLTGGEKVLNCFAYTCSFGVYARAAGAAGVVNVDISRKSLARGQDNYALNRLESDRTEFVRAEALGFMKRACKRENRFGCIILDPPSFSRHEGKTFSVKRDLGTLVGVAMNILKPGGVLLVSTNHSGLSHRALEQAVRHAGRKRVKSIRGLGQDADFCGSGRMPESHLAAVLVKTQIPG